MAYCRFSPNSSVYVYLSDTDLGGIVWVCCQCSLHGASNQLFPTPEGVVTHLGRHQDAGHKVPQEALLRLRMEIKQKGER